MRYLYIHPYSRVMVAKND